MICSSWFVLELDIVLCNEGEIPRNTPAKFLSVSVLGKVVMVREYFNWMLCSEQKVSPVL